VLDSAVTNLEIRGNITTRLKQIFTYADDIFKIQKRVPSFQTDNAHLTYNAHPKLFYIPFEVQITRT